MARASRMAASRSD
uniref:Uncharacterized protein n=1 Tax=Arundo donax TaxID=35708 RepID=A0A0A8ZD68_ARUDO